MMLTDEDREFLDAEYHDRWKLQENEEEGSGIVIRDFRIPDGYSSSKVDLLILIPTDYPMAALDMFYFEPGIKRGDDSSIGGLSEEVHFGRLWQRWSRHYQCQWDPRRDTLITHICYVTNELKSELKRGN